MSAGPLYIGCAGWQLGREYLEAFGANGTHLERYGSTLNAVEINSSFYRAHRPQTYARWASSVEGGFRFSLKVPKTITHELRLQNCSPSLDAFLTECGALGHHLGCLLVQLPPSLTFDPGVAESFFSALRDRFAGDVVVEPRHESWLQAQPLLIEYRIGQVAVDPARISGDDTPAGWQGVRYWRLHGSPVIYSSAYEPAWLAHLADKIGQARCDGVPVWCIFDNTARGQALGNALALKLIVAGVPRGRAELNASGPVNT